MPPLDGEAGRSSARRVGDKSPQRRACAPPDLPTRSGAKRLRHGIRREHMTITGGCRCGAVRYRIEARAAVHPALLVPRLPIYQRGRRHGERVLPKRSGEGRRRARRLCEQGRSGNQMHRHFCAACGTPVFTQSEARRHYIGVRAGSPRRSGARQAADGDLDLERALLGRLRRDHPAGTEATPTAQAERVMRS